MTDGSDITSVELERACFIHIIIYLYKNYIFATEFILFQTGIAEALFNLVAASRFVWLAILGAFALLGWFSRELAAQADSPQTQYIGLGVYVVAEALIFAPLLYIVIVLMYL